MSSCLPTHNIVPHISWHGLPHRRTTKKYADFPSMVIFSCSCRNSGFKHGSVIVKNKFAYFTLSLSTPQGDMVKERCWFSQINVFSLKLSTLGQSFVSSKSILTLFTYKDKGGPFSRCTNKHSQMKLSPNRIYIGCSQIAFPITFLPKDDQADFVQEE